MVQQATAKAKEPQSQAYELENRLMDFAVRIVKSQQAYQGPGQDS